VVLQRIGWRIGLQLWPWLADRLPRAPACCKEFLMRCALAASSTRSAAASFLNLQVLKTAAVVWRTSLIAERISPPFDYVVQGAGRTAKSFLVKHARL
jgi:hypothetical protein